MEKNQIYKYSLNSSVTATIKQRVNKTVYLTRKIEDYIFNKQN